METTPKLFAKPTAAKLGKFCDAAYDAHTLVHQRKFYARAFREITGRWHDAIPIGLEGRQVANPMLEMFRTYVGQLLGTDVLPATEPTGVGTRGDAVMMQVALRQACDDCGYAEQDASVVMDSMIGLGYGHVSRRDSQLPTPMGDENVDEGHPMFQRIGVDQMLMDPNASDWRSVCGIGHVAIYDRQRLFATGVGNMQVLNDIPNVWNDDTQKGLRGASTQRGDRKPGSNPEDEYLTDAIALRVMYYPEGGHWMMCVLPPSGGKDEFVIEPQPLAGEPEGHPYVITDLNPMPGHLCGVSPAMALMDAHIARIAAAAKIADQIERLDRRYMAKKGQEKTAEALMTRETPTHGVVFSNGEPPTEFLIGGLVKEAVEGYAFLEQLGKQIGPNIDLFGGKDAPSDLASTNNLLAGAGATALNYWKNQINRSRSLALRRMAAIITSSQIDRKLSIPSPFGDPIPLIWRGAAQDISYDQFRYSIKPVAIDGGMDPNSQLRRLFEILSAVPRVLQAVTQLGGDPAKTMRAIADMSGMPQLDEIFPTQDSAAIKQALGTLMLTKSLGSPQAANTALMGAQPAASGPTTSTGMLNSTTMKGQPMPIGAM